MLKLAIWYGLFLFYHSVHADQNGPHDHTNKLLNERFDYNQTTINNETTGINGLSIEQLRALCMRMPSKSQLWSTICEGILSVIVGIFGLIGNVATIFVLTRPNFKETFHKLLICLACFDSLFILSALTIYAIRAHALHLRGASFVHFFFLASYPLGNLALYGSTYLTLAVSIERFLGLVYPVQSRTRPKRQLYTYLVPVIGFSVLFNIPKALEFRLFNVLDDNNHTSIEVGESDWARNKYYNQYYKVWSNLLLTAVIPLSLLIFCNMAIFIVLRKNSKAMVEARQKPKSNRVHASTHSSSSNSFSSQDNSLALILAGIVLVFMFCHGLRFFLAFYQVSIVERTDECIEHGLQSPQPEWLYRISALNHLMLMVNSSVNFIIYCLVGSRFRRALTKAFCKLFCHKYGSVPKSVKILHHNHSNLNNSSNNKAVIQKQRKVYEQCRGPKKHDVQEVSKIEAVVVLETRQMKDSNSSNSNPDAIWVNLMSPETKRVEKGRRIFVHDETE